MTSNSISVLKDRYYHESASVKEDGVMLSKRVDNSVISYSSNCLGVEPQYTAKRYSQKAKRIIQAQRLYLIGEYSQIMGGVDRLDQTVAGKKLRKEDTQLEFRREIVQVYMLRFAKPSKCLGKSCTSSSKSRVPDEVRFDCSNHIVKMFEKKVMRWRRMPFENVCSSHSVWEM
ncbi:hypothetical protein PR048_005464 [Dryococelus australis]|uniref:Uncharacterized protein n=1 Tax=Dryococelus australis TaxID=614101 RepID=A0ABQ9IAF8_9NEOP|nr:hypothetical protein PR048_005464 [Dryococelus australis]